MSQTFLVTGASTGFGRSIAWALASNGYTVYAGMYSHDGNTKPYEDEVAKFAKGRIGDLRAVSLDLLSDESVTAAVKHIMENGGRLDGIVHNAGHMGFGFAESFTPSQYMCMYEINVVGCQRLNQAALPIMRKNRSGHLIWMSSSSVYGGKTPMLGPYFAAKAAMDSLAQVYAWELHPWGIETTIVSPGLFTKGTNHFQDAAKPGNPDVAAEYEEGPTKGLSEQTMAGSMSLPPSEADPSMVADAVVDVVKIPKGKKPLRVTVDPNDDGSKEVSPLVDRMAANFHIRCGLETTLKVRQ